MNNSTMQIHEQLNGWDVKSTEFQTSMDFRNQQKLDFVLRSNMSLSQSSKPISTTISYGQKLRVRLDTDIQQKQVKQ